MGKFNCKIFFFFLVLLTLVSCNIVVAQCESFLPINCKTALGEFVHDGNKSTANLSEGETAELFKTFFANQTYRLVVCKTDDLPPVHVRVVDNLGRILFDNKSVNYSSVWDFTVKSTQMLDVQIRVVSENVNKSKVKKGCVSIIFGIDSKS